MSDLTGAQRRHLRGLAHHLSPVVQVGKQGLTGAVVAEVDQALGSHELIKVRCPGPRSFKAQVTAALGSELGAEAVGAVGHVLILYRPAADPEERKIALPA